MSLERKKHQISKIKETKSAGELMRKYEENQKLAATREGEGSDLDVTE